MSRPLRLHRVLLCVLLLCLLASPSFALEAKWTPNEKDADSAGPLPQSQNQRNQLLQLQDAIVNAPDPQGTLQKAAEANNMDPQDLWNLLERNRQDMQQATSSTGANSPRAAGKLGKLVVTIGSISVQWCRKYPRQATLMLTSLLLIMYMLTTASSTGSVLSSQRSVLSKGPTTMFTPPVTFVTDSILSKSSLQQSSSLSLAVADWKHKDTLQELKHLQQLQDDEDDKSIWHTRLPKTSKLQQAASSQVTISMETTLPRDYMDDEELLEQSLELAWEHAASILDSKQWTERLTDKAAQATRMIPRGKSAVLVVKGLGDWNRYGWVGLTATSEQQLDKSKEKELYSTLSTWQNGHFDGQIHVSIVKHGDDNMVVRVYLLIPKQGTKLSRKYAMVIVENLASSIAASIQTRTQQSFARRMQSSAFAKRAKQRAQKRRKSRFDKEQSIEEMATDRRRRWQRSNPNAGHYRPSGDRMRSPNNAVYK